MKLKLFTVIFLLFSVMSFAGEYEELIKKLNSDNEVEQCKAVLNLKKLGDKRAIRTIITILQNSSSSKNQNISLDDLCYEALLHFNDKSAVEPLIKLLNVSADYYYIMWILDNIDPDWVNSAQAQRMYEDLKFQIIESRGDNRTIFNLMKKINPRATAEFFLNRWELFGEYDINDYVDCLIETDYSESTDILKQKYFDKKYSSYKIAEALNKFDPDWYLAKEATEEVEILKKMVKSSSFETVQSAIAKLYYIKTEESTNILMSLVNRPEPNLRAWVVKELTERGVSIDIEILKSAVIDYEKNSEAYRSWSDEYDLMETAVKTLGIMNNVDSIQFLFYCLDSNNSDIAISAAKALSGTSSRDALVKPLCKMISQPELDYSIVNDAFEILVNIGEPEAIPVIAKFTELDEWVACDAIRALEQFPPEITYEHMVHVLSNAYKAYVRQKAVETLGRAEFKSAKPYLEKSRKDSDPAVRATAEWALYRLSLIPDEEETEN